MNSDYYADGPLRQLCFLFPSVLEVMETDKYVWELREKREKCDGGVWDLNERLNDDAKVHSFFFMNCSPSCKHVGGRL